jgi:hypothetical protein
LLALCANTYDEKWKRQIMYTYMCLLVGALLYFLGIQLKKVHNIINC